jgi:MFS family permease
VTTVGAIAGPNLAPLANDAGVGLGLHDYSGPYLLSAAGLAVAALAITLFMRPDPLLVASTQKSAEPTAAGGGWRAAARAVRARRGAWLGMSAMAVGHVVMVGVMSMTPVYISGYVHQHGDQLRIVGLVISLHIVGMYVLSPVVGWLADRFGPRPVILGGIGVLLGACALAGTAGHSTPRLSVALALIGAGWLACMVAGSTVLSASVPVEQRTAAQGLSDVVMGVAGASAGAVSGVVTDYFGYPTLTLLAAIATVPLLALALRPLPVRDGTLVRCD